jgi:integrase
MESVKPLRDGDAVKRMTKALAAKHGKYKVMWLIGIETGLRIGDILKLRVSDVSGGELVVQEQKTNKVKSVKLSVSLMRVISAHQRKYDLRDDHYLVFSRDHLRYRSVTRQHAWRVVKAVSRSIGFEGIGTHSMRKTFARDRFFASGGDMEAVRRSLSHDHLITTLGYLCGPRALADMIARYADEMGTEGAAAVNGIVE